MLRYLPPLAMAALTVTPLQPVMAQASAKPTTCQSLTAQWDLVEIELARSSADGVADNSAPRATLRATEDLASLQKASIILDLMRGHTCKLPTAPPSSITYMLPALQCRNAQRTVADAPECDTKTWKRLGE